MMVCWKVDLSLCVHGDRSGFVGLPKVKRDKFSVFNFLTVTESKDPPGEFSPPLQAGGAVSSPHIFLSPVQRLRRNPAGMFPTSRRRRTL